MYACVSSRRTRIHRRTIFYAYVFLRKHLEEGVYQVSAVSASDVLKRNTDSLRCAVENDVFDSLLQDWPGAQETVQEILKGDE